MVCNLAIFNWGLPNKSGALLPHQSTWKGSVTLLQHIGMYTNPCVSNLEVAVLTTLSQPTVNSGLLLNV